MKKIFIHLTVLVVVSIINNSLCNAEKIYCKDAKIVEGEIISHNRRSVYLAPGYKDAGAQVEVSVGDIDRIENDDGSISKYDYVSLYRMSGVCIKQKDYKEAVRLYSLLLETFPENTHVRYLRGILNHTLGRFDEASEDYKFLIEHNAAEVAIFNNLGAIYARKKEYKKAMNCLVRAITEQPEMPEAHDNLAELLMQTEDYNRAIDEYKKVIELEPDNIEALYNLGIAYMNTGNSSEAKKQWERVLAIRPEDNDAKKVLEYIKTKSNKK